MFHSARLKLTAWYLLIIMAISFAFSLFIYFGSTREFDRILRVQRYRLNNPARIRVFQSDIPLPINPPDPDVIEEAKTRVFEGLLGVNIVILIVSSVAGYFLAGRTLKPIAKMVDEQNRFITDASHELRTPITSLRAEMEVGLRDSTLTLQGARDLLKSGLEEVKNLQELSDSLLVLSQPEKQNGSSLFAAIPLSPIISEAIKKVKPLAVKKHIKIHSNLQKVQVTADKQSLVQLFIILLDNAVKYSKAKKEIRVSSEKSDGRILVYVRDQGVGISKRDQEHIFDRFYRVDSSRSKDGVSGYGLGLSIAKNIVETQHGKISVKSEAGIGSTFTVEFPTVS